MFNLCFQIQPKKKQITLQLAHGALPVLFHPKPGWLGHLMSILAPKFPLVVTALLGTCKLMQELHAPQSHMLAASVTVPAGTAHQRVTSLEFSSDRPCVRTQGTMATLKVYLQTFCSCCSLYIKYPQVAEWKEKG